MPTIDPMVLSVLGFVGGVFVAFGLGRWRASKGAASVFAQDGNLEQIGFSAISAALDSRSVDRIDGFKELRPTWGIRLFAPLLAIVLLVAADAGPVFASLLVSLGLKNPVWADFAMVLIAAAFAYTWVMLLFYQRVIYDEVGIESIGTNIMSETRSLKDLVDIRVHEKRPTLVLSFADQKPLYIPKFISQRAMFLSDMEALIAKNRAQGMVAAPQNLAARMGF